MKTCPACKIEKPRSEFYNMRGGCARLSSWCKVCMKRRIPGENKVKRRKERAKNYRKSPKGKNAALKRKYGINLEQYADILKDQGGCCAICGTDKPGGTGRFHVDHINGAKPHVVRGILCSRCNPGLGCFKHDIKILARAIQYLSH